VPQALVDAPGTNPNTRIAAAWYANSSFTIDVAVTDGKSHNIELYLLDYDSGGRSEQVQLSDDNTHAVLDTETVANFTGGVYLSWTISGNVLITFTKQTGPNAVVSGLFFDPAPPPPGNNNNAIGGGPGSGGSGSGIGLSSQLGAGTFDVKDVTTQGSWDTTYGSQGYYAVNSGGVPPAYATVNTSGQSSDTWAAITTDTTEAAPPRRSAARAASPSVGTPLPVSRWT